MLSGRHYQNLEERKRSSTTAAKIQGDTTHSADRNPAVLNDSDEVKKGQSHKAMFNCSINTIKMGVLLILCLQNSMFTILRRYSQGVLKEVYATHEVLIVGEVIKMVFSAWMITGNLSEGESLATRLNFLVRKSGKMFILALIYGAMNILSYVSLRNIGAGIFTIFAQCKILTTATFSSIILRRQYSWARWRALISLMMGVLLFTEPIWNDFDKPMVQDGGNAMVGTVAVLIEVSLSGFASIYFEKVIKTDKDQLGIWERNFQLALGSFPVYFLFILWNGGGQAGYLGGWSPVAWCLAFLGAAGGLLVALSIKYGDSILKTLATTGAIIVSSVLDYMVLGGDLTPVMCIAGSQVIIAIMNYSFDTTPVTVSPDPTSVDKVTDSECDENEKENETEALLSNSADDGPILRSHKSTDSLAVK